MSRICTGLVPRSGKIRLAFYVLTGVTWFLSLLSLKTRALANGEATDVETMPDVRGTYFLLWGDALLALPATLDSDGIIIYDMGTGEGVADLQLTRLVDSMEVTRRIGSGVFVPEDADAFRRARGIGIMIEWRHEEGRKATIPITHTC